MQNISSKNIKRNNIAKDQNHGGGLNEGDDNNNSDISTHLVLPLSSRTWKVATYSTPLKIIIHVKYTST